MSKFAKYFHVLQALVLAVLCACGTSSAASTGAPDAAAEVASTADVAAQADTSADVAAAMDASGAVHATSWGPISGVCSGLSASLDPTTPGFLFNTWQFAAPGPFDPLPLRSGAKKRYDGPNAGGSSKCSEVMSMQLLFECAGATTLKTEVEMVYDKQGEMIDWLAQVGSEKVAVSVTRAYKGPNGNTYSAEDAKTLLTKKLQGLIGAAANVSAADKWSRQILHIWTLRADWVPVLQKSWQQLDAGLKANTLVVVTVEAGSTDVVADTCQ